MFLPVKFEINIGARNLVIREYRIENSMKVEVKNHRSIKDCNTESGLFRI